MFICSVGCPWYVQNSTRRCRGAAGSGCTSQACCSAWGETSKEFCFHTKGILPKLTKLFQTLHVYCIVLQCLAHAKPAQCSCFHVPSPVECLKFVRRDALAKQGLGNSPPSTANKRLCCDPPHSELLNYGADVGKKQNQIFRLGPLNLSQLILS